MAAETNIGWEQKNEFLLFSENIYGVCIKIRMSIWKIFVWESFLIAALPQKSLWVRTNFFLFLDKNNPQQSLLMATLLDREKP